MGHSILVFTAKTRTWGTPKYQTNLIIPSQSAPSYSSKMLQWDFALDYRSYIESHHDHRRFIILYLFIEGKMADLSNVSRSRRFRVWYLRTIGVLFFTM